MTLRDCFGHHITLCDTRSSKMITFNTLQVGQQATDGTDTAAGLGCIPSEITQNMKLVFYFTLYWTTKVTSRLFSGTADLDLTLLFNLKTPQETSTTSRKKPQAEPGLRCTAISFD